MKKVEVTAHGSLADFLGRIAAPDPERRLSAPFRFDSRQLAKDAIEGVGVPHPEIDLALVDGESIDFDYDLRDGMRIDVYPQGHPEADRHESRVRVPEPPTLRFLVDENLGQLATQLQMLGFDAAFASNSGDAAIAKRASDEDRILLSRDIGILKRAIVRRGLWIRSDDPHRQITQTIRRYSLWPRIQPFTRCLACNTEIEAVTRSLAKAKVPPHAWEANDEFFHCPSCERMYWKGSHFDRMTKWLDELRSELEAAPSATEIST